MSRELARWAAVTIGIVAGILFFGIGIQAFFIGGATSTWSVIIWAATVLGLLALLPLSILGIFKPRIAAYGVLVSCIVFSVYLFWPVGAGEKMEFSISGLGWLMLPCAVAALLFYASGREAAPGERTRGREDWVGIAQRTEGFGTIRPWLVEALVAMVRAGRKRQAQWAGVVFGLIAGGLGLRWGMRWVVVFAEQRNWWAVAGIAAFALTLFPLSILAIFKPRVAACGILGSLAVALAYPLSVSLSSQFGLADTVSKVIFCLLVSFPFGVTGALLLYASTEPHRKT